MSTGEGGNGSGHSGGLCLHPKGSTDHQQCIWGGTLGCQRKVETCRTEDVGRGVRIIFSI